MALARRVPGAGLALAYYTHTWRFCISYYVCVCDMGGSISHGAHVEVGGQLSGLGSFLSLSHGIKLRSHTKYFYLLSHPTRHPYILKAR